jgi:hypothetical protein
VLSRILESSYRCAAWFRQLHVDTDDERVLHGDGTLLCLALANGLRINPSQSHSEFIQLPNPSILVRMDRAELIELCRGYSGGPWSANDSDLAIGHLATAFARADDLQVTAALLKLAVLVGVDADVTADTWDYVLSQQRPGGAFGLMSAEMALLKSSQSKNMLHMAISVEVLNAMAAYGGVFGQPASRLLTPNPSRAGTC